LLFDGQLRQGRPDDLRVEYAAKLDRRVVAGRFERRLIAAERGRGLLPSDMVDVRVMREAVEPREEWPALPTVTVDRLPRLQEDELGQILGVEMAPPLLPS
jgi:hypothetical protein